ncbi:hypothetical protein GCM10027277_01990 [Pseudoduganella ginsengisoli]|uniref:Monoheme cytochrome SoxX n=1 Tax=Pseudoduganella ginsengisoli TaxID=1462440 RepID=A0A6L6Q8P6_9BURK|nr:hypothetical protein [Pseudoduganella ginsengisoli]MTW05819.1 hypothetical protein [Pseudoduganella ginsengisoli]
MNMLFGPTLHLAYLCSGRLETWRWRRGVLAAGPVFEPTRAGIDALADHMVALGRPPVHLLADLVEEDFHRLLLPHARGRAGRNLLARRLQQHYRETPYRRAAMQGRQPEHEGGGRRDDIVLMSALTNPATVQQWTEALTLVQAPVAGIWSAALLYEGVPQALGFTQPHILLVTWQSCGMRQSYFRDGQLKFSRLAPAQAECAAETARTRQFLVSAHLLERDDMLHAIIVTHDDAIAPLSEQCISSTETTFHFVPLAIALERCGADAGGAEATMLADTVLLHVLARTLPRSHYPCGADARYFRLWQARVSLYASALVVAACALVWTGLNLWAYADANVSAATLAEETRHFTARYRSAMAPVGPTAAPTADMRAAVLVDRLLADQGPAPLDMLSQLSGALDRAPQVQLVALNWQVEPPGGGAPAKSTAARGQPSLPAAAGDAASTGSVPSSLLGIPVKPRQSLRVEAEVRLPRPDAKGAVDSMNAFARDLARLPRMRVAIEQPVLDIRPDVKLSGRATAEAAPPVPFTLRLELAP